MIFMGKTFREECTMTTWTKVWLQWKEIADKATGALQPVLASDEWQAV